MIAKLLTPVEAAALKGVTRSAVYKAIAEGRLPHQKVLNRLALAETDVIAWDPQSHGGSRNLTPMSEEAKAKLSKTQKKRWQDRKGIPDTLFTN